MGEDLHAAVGKTIADWGTRMKSSRKRKLKAVEPGDVVFGFGAGGQPKLLLVVKATKAKIVARHVTSQLTFEFDRDGRTGKMKGGGSVEIASVRPLPRDAYGIVLGLDRKMRLGQFPDGFLLSQDERKLLLRMDEYFMARPLIDGKEPMEMPEGAQPASFDLT
jgi:hypothetical protein